MRYRNHLLGWGLRIEGKMNDQCAEGGTEMSRQKGDGKQELESMLRSLGYSDDDFRVTTIGGDISASDRIELEILEEKFEGSYSEIYQALSQSENARQVVSSLSEQGLRRRVGDDG